MVRIDIFLIRIFYFFLGSKKLEAKFAISKNPFFNNYKLPIEWEPKTVISLNFSGINYENIDYFDFSLNRQIITKMFPNEKNIINLMDYFKVFSPADVFSIGCENFKKNELVLLIDEYDSPLNHSMNDPHKFEKLTRKYLNFFQMLKIKAEEKYIYKSVVTGILKFSQVGIFSGKEYIYNLYL